VLYQALIQRYASGRKVICIIDEAQSMPAPLLEQIRLLTNLETHKDKLLTLILVGQPELQQTLAQHSIRQLDQRITARFHLKAMEQKQVKPYLQHRLQQAGGDQILFNDDAISYIWQAAKGIPRLLNSISDRALLGAYATSQPKVTKAIAKQAVFEVMGEKYKAPVLVNSAVSSPARLAVRITALAAVFIVTLIASLWLLNKSGNEALSFNKISNLWLDNHYQLLAQANGLDTEQLDFESCQQIEDSSEYACLSLDWPLKDLRRLQKPIAAFDGKQWSLVLANQLVTRPISNLILWQPMAGYSAGLEKAIKPGESHELIAWVRHQLNDFQLTGQAVSEWQVIAPAGQQSMSFHTFYDPILAGKIALFQKQVGLKSDRMIGLKTLLALQALVNEKGV